MAELHLITGQPGHGKSLYAISLGLAFVAEGREVYATGFKGLDYNSTGFKELPYDFTKFDSADRDDQNRILTKWQQLPHGSVIMLDECYDYIPQRAAGKPVPPHVDSLARHRHTGHDIILVTQKHGQIDSFVQGLIGQHTHVRRKFGLNAAALRKWDRFSANVLGNDTTEIQRWVYPKKNYALYTSATQHSVKRKLPWFVFALPIMICVVPLLGWYAWHGFSKQADVTHVTGALATGAGGASQSGDQSKRDDSLRASDYARWMTARVPGQPWTAPAYDHLQTQSVPEIFCIAVEDMRCKCITEQGTTYALKLDLCRSVAKDGMYNPFKGKADNERGRDEHSDPSAQVASVADPRSRLPVIEGRMAASDYRSLPQTYKPPEETTADGAGR
jgi:zona occludens toxin